MTSLNASEPALRIRPAAAGTPAISFIDVSKRFPTAEGRMLEVLRGVSFDLPSTEIVAIVGPSGAGKSTLLNLAAGLILPDHGEGRIPRRAPAGAVGWGRVASMSQDARLVPWRVALANVTLALEAGTMPAAERRRRAHDALALVGLAEFAKAYPHQLSGGMRSRVALARSLVGEPDLLLMHEPFSP